MHLWRYIDSCLKRQRHNLGEINIWLYCFCRQERVQDDVRETKTVTVYQNLMITLIRTVNIGLFFEPDRLEEEIYLLV